MYGISIQRLYMNIYIYTYIYVAYLSFSLAERNFTVYLSCSPVKSWCVSILYLNSSTSYRGARLSLPSQVFIPRPCLWGIHGQGAKTHAVIPMARQTWPASALDSTWSTVFPSCFLLLFFFLPFNKNLRTAVIPALEWKMKWICKFYCRPRIKATPCSWK